MSLREVFRIVAESKLIIVESPHKAKTIQQFLDKSYSVKATSGHIWNLPTSQFGVDIEKDFTPKYVTIRGQGKVVSELKTAAKKAQRVILATDPDREGEAISWHLSQALQLSGKEERIEFNEITPKAIAAALQSPRRIDMQKVHAQQARRVLDRVIGYPLSQLLWKKVRSGLSAGRVQSVAVRLIVDREAEIKAFKPTEYWTIDVHLEKEDAQTLTAKVVSLGGRKLEIGNGQDAAGHKKALSSSTYTIKKVGRKEKLKRPLAPFTTSTMQQEASRKLGFSARKTMVLSQRLYEGIELGSEGSVGLITYMRTDSVNVAEDAQEESARFIEEHFGAKYKPAKPNRYKTKTMAAQEAHEAIRPTSVYRLPDTVKKYLERDQYRLYQLIWSRFVASQMKPAVFDTIAVDIEAGDYLCRANGSSLKFPGYLEVYQEGRDDEAEENGSLLPPLDEGEALKLTQEGVEPKQHFTQPPPRYTEAVLVKTLEEKGIGRPSTYAPTIDTILKRNYVQLEEKRFHPTKLGEVVVQLLKEHFADVVDLDFTAELENQLDLVEEGNIPWNKVVSEFYDPFMADLEKAKDTVERVQLEDEVSDIICERCGRRMVYKYGRFGKFLGCPGYPECKNTKPIRKELGVACPICGQPVVERRTKKGRRFYGCSAYPECKFVSWEKPAETPCPQCGSFAVVKGPKDGPRELICLKADCAHVEPYQEDRQNG